MKYKVDDIVFLNGSNLRVKILEMSDIYYTIHYIDDDHISKFYWNDYGINRKAYELELLFYE